LTHVHKQTQTYLICKI